MSIFFLPLTFVTSVFGMSNMPTENEFKVFGIVMSTVCIPFFFLIGSLNTTQGMRFWRSKWHRLLAWILGKKPPQTKAELEEEDDRRSRPGTFYLSRKIHQSFVSVCLMNNRYPTPQKAQTYSVNVHSYAETPGTNQTLEYTQRQPGCAIDSSF